MAVKYGEGVYQVAGKGITHPLDGAAYVLINQRHGGHTLIDAAGMFDDTDSEAGTPRTPAMHYDTITDQLAKLAILPEHITRIILTHIHDDHSAGSNRFPNAEVLMHRAEQPAAESLDVFGRASFLYHKNPTELHNKRYVDDGHQERTGKFITTLVHAPWHSPGSAAVTVQSRYEPSELYMMAGDSLSGGCHPFIGSDPGQTEATIEKLRKLKPTKLVTGHGSNRPSKDPELFFRIQLQSFMRRFEPSHDGLYFNPWEWNDPHLLLDGSRAKLPPEAVRQVIDTALSGEQYAKYRDQVAAWQLQSWNYET